MVRSSKGSSMTHWWTFLSGIFLATTFFSLNWSPATFLPNLPNRPGTETSNTNLLEDAWSPLTSSSNCSRFNKERDIYCTSLQTCMRWQTPPFRERKYGAWSIPYFPSCEPILLPWILGTWWMHIRDSDLSIFLSLFVSYLSHMLATVVLSAQTFQQYYSCKWSSNLMPVGTQNTALFLDQTLPIIEQLI